MNSENSLGSRRRVVFGWMVFVAGLLSAPATADVESRFEESTRLGKPMFIVATSESCPPCRALKHVMRTDASVQQRLRHFIVLQLDVHSDAFADFSTQVPHDLNRIPAVFMLRPDGKMLYGQSGGMSADALDRLLASGLSASGRALTETDYQVLSRRLSKAERAYAAGDVLHAYRDVSPICSFPSYARPVEDAKRLQHQIGSHIARQLGELQSDMVRLADEFHTVVAITSLFVASEGDAPLRETLGNFMAQMGANPATQTVLSQAKETVRGQIYESHRKWEAAAASYRRVLQLDGTEEARRYAQARLDDLVGEVASNSGRTKKALSNDQNLVEPRRVAQSQVAGAKSPRDSSRSVSTVRADRLSAVQYLKLAKFYKKRHPRTAETYARLAIDRASSDDVTRAARALLRQL